MEKIKHIKWYLLLLIALFLFWIAIAQEESLTPITSIQPTISAPQIQKPSVSQMRAHILCLSWSTPWTWFESTNVCECPEATKNIDWVCRSCAEKDVCCGIKLNTKVPFIGNCIEFAKNCKDDKCPNSGYQCVNWKCRVVKNDPSQTVVDQEEAFPILMWWLVKILVTIIILAGFIGILAGGVMISAAWSDDQKAAKWRKLIINVAIAIAILWASWVILRLINPNFFW